MTVDPYETLPCSCGKKGCLEQYASATGMVRVAKKFLADWSGETLLRQCEITAKTLWDCAKAVDRTMQDTVLRYGTGRGDAYAQYVCPADAA